MFERGDSADTLRGTDQHNANEYALDAIQPLVRDLRCLTRKRGERAGLHQERREPFQPQQHPAVIPLEAWLGDGWGVQTHAREFTGGASLSD